MTEQHFRQRVALARPGYGRLRVRDVLASILDRAAEARALLDLRECLLERPERRASFSRLRCACDPEFVMNTRVT
jgi:hypothetical protein